LYWGLFIDKASVKIPVNIIFDGQLRTWKRWWFLLNQIFCLNDFNSVSSKNISRFQFIKRLLRFSHAKSKCRVLVIKINEKIKHSKFGRLLYNYPPWHFQILRSESDYSFLHIMRRFVIIINSSHNILSNFSIRVKSIFTIYKNNLWFLKIAANACKQPKMRIKTFRWLWPYRRLSSKLLEKNDYDLPLVLMCHKHLFIFF